MSGFGGGAGGEFPGMKTPLRQKLKSPPGTQEPTAILQGPFVLGRSQPGEPHGDVDGILVPVSSKSLVVAQICTVLPGGKGICSAVHPTPSHPQPFLHCISYSTAGVLRMSIPLGNSRTREIATGQVQRPRQSVSIASPC